MALSSGEDIRAKPHEGTHAREKRRTNKNGEEREREREKDKKKERKNGAVDRPSVREYVDLGQVVNRDSKSA